MKQKEFEQFASDFSNSFPKRKRDANKGDFGRVFILAGSEGLAGAGLLASIGALRAGAGLVSLGTAESCAGMVLGKVPEVMVKPLPQTQEGSVSLQAYTKIKQFLEKQNVFALGPGLSQNSETQNLIRSLVLESSIPMVIDADGLNAFDGHLDEMKKIKAQAVITPHPGEFMRLFGVKVTEDEQNRVEAAKKASKDLGLIVVLKGAGTVVASPEGACFVNPTGNPGMAKGGSGDILTGMTAAFLGEGLKPFDAAKWAVFVHGYAGDLAAKALDEISMTPGDLLNCIPQAFKDLRGE